MKNIISNLKKSDTWKIQLTIAINFISSSDNDEERVMHSYNTEIMINHEADEVTKEVFKLELIKGSEFFLNYINLL